MGPLAAISPRRARYNGRPSRTTRRVAYKRLNDEQEASLMGWIRPLDTIRIPPTASTVVMNAHVLLHSNDHTTPPLGQDWVYYFVSKSLPKELNWVK